MGLWTTTSCLVTDELEPRIDPPSPENSRPRFVEGSISPKNWQPIVPVNDYECRNPKFSIGTVIDANVNDTLYVRWFADYDASPGAAKAVTKEGTIPPSGAEARAGGDYLEWELPLAQYCAGYHMVKVLVADRQFLATTEKDAVDDKTGTASYAWAVDISRCVNAKGPCP